MLVWSVHSHGSVVTRDSWEQIGERTSSQDRTGEGWGWKQVRLKKDPASWVSALAREEMPISDPKPRAMGAELGPGWLRTMSPSLPHSKQQCFLRTKCCAGPGRVCFGPRLLSPLCSCSSLLGSVWGKDF
jgi:hypothetical protein